MGRGGKNTTDAERKAMISWLQVKANFDWITGPIFKGAVFLGPNKERTGPYSKLADHVNTNCGTKWNSHSARSRYLSYLGLYRFAHSKSLESGFDVVTEKDREKGLISRNEKLNDLCPFYQDMHALFADSPPSEIELHHKSRRIQQQQAKNKEASSSKRRRGSASSNNTLAPAPSTVSDETVTVPLPEKKRLKSGRSKSATGNEDTTNHLDKDTKNHDGSPQTHDSDSRVLLHHNVHPSGSPVAHGQFEPLNHSGFSHGSPERYSQYSHRSMSKSPQSISPSNSISPQRSYDSIPFSGTVLPPIIRTPSLETCTSKGTILSTDDRRKIDDGSYTPILVVESLLSLAKGSPQRTISPTQYAIVSEWDRKHATPSALPPLSSILNGAESEHNVVKSENYPPKIENSSSEPTKSLQLPPLSSLFSDIGPRPPTPPEALSSNYPCRLPSTLNSTGIDMMHPPPSCPPTPPPSCTHSLGLQTGITTPSNQETATWNRHSIKTPSSEGYTNHVQHPHHEYTPLRSHLPKGVPVVNSQSLISLSLNPISSAQEPHLDGPKTEP